MKSVTAGPLGAARAGSAFCLGGDLTIRRVGFGAMRLPRDGWHGPARDPQTGRAVLQRAVELGVNHIDTADFYRSGDGAVRANSLIRQALHPYPPGLVIATKVGPHFGPNGPASAAPGEMRGLVEANLTSLGLDRLDLVYLRIGQMAPPHGESLAKRFEALAALRQEGLIRHLGLSNVTAEHLAEARAIAPVVAVQNSFHLARREDVSVLDVCAASGIAFVPFGPMGGGHADLNNPAIEKVAARHDVEVVQIALTWLLALSPITLAIPGTGSLAHLQQNIAAGSIVLTPDDLAELGMGGPSRQAAHP